VELLKFDQLVRDRAFVIHGHARILDSYSEGPRGCVLTASTDPMVCRYSGIRCPEGGKSDTLGGRMLGHDNPHLRGLTVVFGSAHIRQYGRLDVN
jgi:hypothetical protein